jgi:hypothetical protein
MRARVGESASGVADDSGTSGGAGPAAPLRRPSGAPPAPLRRLAAFRPGYRRRPGLAKMEERNASQGIHHAGNGDTKSMARNRGRGPQRPVKGFRPGKEPPELRKRQAKQQFGDLSPTQERLVELFAERGPEASRGLLRRWELGFMAGAIVAAILAVVLLVVGATWSVITGVIVAIVAAVLVALWWRLRSQRGALEEMADAVGGRGRGRHRK